MSLRSAIRFKLFSNIRYQTFWITKAGFVVKININGGIVIRSVEFLAEVVGEYTFEKCWECKKWCEDKSAETIFVSVEICALLNLRLPGRSAYPHNLSEFLDIFQWYLYSPATSMILDEVVNTQFWMKDFTGGKRLCFDWSTTDLIFSISYKE